MGVHHLVDPQGPVALSSPPRPAAVLWWESAARAEPAAWLAVRAGSPPLDAQAWLAQLALPPAEPGGWALTGWVALEALPAELAARLAEPAGEPRKGLAAVAFAADGGPLEGPFSAELYDACRAAAPALVTARLADAIVVREPRRSGVLLIRIATDAGRRVLEVVPAGEDPAWRGRPLDLFLDDLGAETVEPEFATVTVSLAGRALELPCARLRLAGGAGATMRVRLPALHFPGAPEPVVRLQLA